MFRSSLRVRPLGHSLLSCAGFFLLACWSVICRAQDGHPDLAQMSLEDLSQIRVYSASKHLQTLSDAPSSVTIVTAEEIQLYGYRTLADILRSVRGFYVTYNRDYSYIGVRGFGRLGDWNSRVLVLVDGHRINDNILGQAMIGSEFLVDVDLIERVEIVRGPSSSLYGAEAFFAVINVITRKPTKLKSIELSFDREAFGTYQGRATYAGQHKGLDVVVSDTFYNSQGPALFFPEFNTSSTNLGITRNTDYESYQHALVTLSYRGFTLQALGSTREKGVPTGYFGATFNDARTRNVDDHEYLDLSYQHKLGKDWELAARTSYDQANLYAPLPDATDPETISSPDAFSFRGRWWNSELKCSGTLFQKHRLALGTELTDNFMQNQGDFTAETNVFVPVRSSSVVWALYGQDEFAITPKLTLSAGLRYDHYYNFGGTTNPRLGLIYHFRPSTTAKLLYGTAFRAPEPFEIYPNFGRFYTTNLALRPETIRTIEAVVEQTFGARFSLSGNIFHNRIRNLITLDNDSADPLALYQNSENTNATGGEIELAAHLAGGWQGRASYSYSQVADSIGKTPPNSPSQLTKLNLAIPLLNHRMSAGLEAQYTSSRSTLAGNTVSGFGVLNATLLAHTLSKHIDLSASLYNLTGKKYFDPGRPESPEDALQQDKRTFRLKLTYRFGAEKNTNHQ